MFCVRISRLGRKSPRFLLVPYFVQRAVILAEWNDVDTRVGAGRYHKEELAPAVH